MLRPPCGPPGLRRHGNTMIASASTRRVTTDGTPVTKGHPARSSACGRPIGLADPVFTTPLNHPREPQVTLPSQVLGAPSLGASRSRVAQLAERPAVNRQVTGSSPVAGAFAQIRVLILDQDGKLATTYLRFVVSGRSYQTLSPRSTASAPPSMKITCPVTWLFSVPISQASSGAICSGPAWP